MSSEKINQLNSFSDRFAYVIVKIKQLHGYTQKKIAEEIGISSPGLSRLISGESKTAAGTTLSALESKFKVNPEWLTKRKGEPFGTANAIEERLLQSSFNKRFADLIKILESEKGHHIEDIEKITGISKSAIIDLVIGRVKVANSKILESFESHFDVTPKWLLTGVGNMFNSDTPLSNIGVPSAPEGLYDQLLVEKDRLISEKSDRIQSLEKDKEELRADKRQLTSRIEGLEVERQELRAEITELKRELESPEKGKNSA